MNDKNIEGMEYLNGFEPNNILIEDKMSYGEFCHSITLATVVAKGAAKFNRKDIVMFNSEKPVLFTDEVSLVFADYKDEAVEKRFKASFLPGLPESQFTAGEMFFHIMTTQYELDECISGFFKKVIFSRYFEENGKRIPQFMVIFH